MKSFAIILSTAALIVTGCSHGLKRGHVAMKVNEQEAHVSMGKNEVKIGDKVALFVNKCPTEIKIDRDYCDKEKLGEGEIIRILNEHYSVIKVAPGVSFEEGAVVERL